MVEVEINMIDGTVERLTVSEFTEKQYHPHRVKSIQLSDIETIEYSMTVPSKELLSDEEFNEITVILMDIEGEKDRIIAPSIVLRVLNLNAELKFALIEMRDHYKELKEFTIKGINLLAIIPENLKLLREIISSFSNLEELSVIDANLAYDTNRGILQSLLDAALNCQQLKSLSLVNNYLFDALFLWEQDLLTNDNFLSIARFLLQHRKLQSIDLCSNRLLYTDQQMQQIFLNQIPDSIFPQFIGVMLLCCPSLRTINLLLPQDLGMLECYGNIYCEATRTVLSNFRVESIKGLYQIKPDQSRNYNTEEAKFFTLVSHLLDLNSLNAGSNILKQIRSEIDIIFLYQVSLLKALSEIGIRLEDLDMQMTASFKPLITQVFRAFRRQLDDASGTQSMGELTVLAGKYGFAAQSMPRDNNCMFHALLNQLKLMGLCLDLNHLSFRQEIVKYIRDNISEFRDFFAEKDQEHIEIHLRNMEKPGTWGAEEIFAAVSKKYQVNIWVLNSHAGDEKITGFKNPWLCYQCSDQAGNYDSSLPRIVVGFDAAERHYYSLMPTKKLQARRTITSTASISTSSSSSPAETKSSIDDVDHSCSSATLSFLPAFNRESQVATEVLPVVQDSHKVFFICDLFDSLQQDLSSKKRTECLLHIKFSILGYLLELHLLGLANLAKSGITNVDILIPGINKKDLDKLFKVEFGFKFPQKGKEELLLLTPDKLDPDFYTKLEDLNKILSQFSKNGDLTYTFLENGITIKIITESFSLDYYNRSNVGGLVALDTKQALDLAIAAGKLVLFGPKNTSYFGEKIALYEKKFGTTSPIYVFYWQQDNRGTLNQQDDPNIFYKELQSLVKVYANVLYKYFKSREELLEQAKVLLTSKHSYCCK